MAKRIFVTATNTDVGKTYTTKLLLREYASRGLRVGVFKPVETGVVDGVRLDGDALYTLVCELNPEFTSLCVSDIVPITYALPAAPFISSGGETFDFAKVESAIKKVERLCDVLIIEGAGGLYVPLDENYMMIDLIKSFHATTLLVTHCSLGCINDTLLSSRALSSEQLSHATVFNCRAGDENFYKVSEPYFIKKGINVLKTSDDIDTLCDVLYNLG